MQTIDINRAVRCIAIVLANNEMGQYIAKNLISNMFDLDRDVAMSKFLRAKAHLLRHKKAGGGLKDFEDGKFTVE